MQDTRDGTDGEPVRMVTLTLLADQDYLALARTSAMHVGALLFFPLPQVNDLRLAVDEACSLFLRPAADADADGAPRTTTETMQLSYERYPDSLHVTVRSRAPEGWPDADELAWATLNTLVGEVRAGVQDGVGTLTLVEALPSAAAG